MHRVHAPGARPPVVVLADGEVHHLTRVLRLPVGTDVIVFDGLGHEWLGRLSSVSRSRVTIALGDVRTPIAEPPVRVTLGIGVLKGTQLDDVIRQATVLGAVAVVPFVSAHVAVAERAWKNRPVDRWQRVAVSAAAQCSRSVVPDVLPISSVGALMASPEFDARIVCVEPGAGVASSVTAVPRPASALLLVGPEGGWTADELSQARAAGAVCISLGPRTLRADTAPTVALAALWTHWGWT